MRLSSMLLVAALLSACGGSNNASTPNDGSSGTQLTSSFTLNYPKTTDFKVGRGETKTFTVSVDITKPELVDEVKVTLVAGPSVIITPSSDASIKDGGSFTFNVKVPETTTQTKPYFAFSAEGVGDSRNQELIQATFSWLLE